MLGNSSRSLGLLVLDRDVLQLAGLSLISSILPSVSNAVVYTDTERYPNRNFVDSGFRDMYICLLIFLGTGTRN